VKQNFLEAKADLKKFEQDLEKRYAVLKNLLDNYNDGRSKGLYCLVANDMPLDELESLMRKIDKLPKEIGVKETSALIKQEIESIGKRLGIQFKLRK
jgi:hypothetical protein